MTDTPPAKPNWERAALLGLTAGCLIACVLLSVSAAYRVNNFECSRAAPGECGFERDLARSTAQKQWFFGAGLGAIGLGTMFWLRASSKKKGSHS